MPSTRYGLNRSPVPFGTHGALGISICQHFFRTATRQLLSTLATICPSIFNIHRIFQLTFLLFISYFTLFIIRRYLFTYIDRSFQYLTYLAYLSKGRGVNKLSPLFLFQLIVCFLASVDCPSFRWLVFCLDRPSSTVLRSSSILDPKLQHFYAPYASEL